MSTPSEGEEPSFRFDDVLMNHRDQLLATWLLYSGYTPANTVVCESTVIENDGSVTTRLWFARKDTNSGNP